MKNILITRPQNQAQELNLMLAAHGFNSFIESLFTVEKLRVAKVTTLVTAAIITSVNAIFALENSGLPKEIKVFTVGKKTAEKLQQSGFKNIILSPENSSESLQDLIADEAGNILYLCGSKISFDFAKSFRNVSDILAYKTHAIKNFSADFLNFSAKNSCDEVLIFSRNSAEIFFKLAKQHNMLEYFSASQIVCLSEKIRERVEELAEELSFKKVKTFSEVPILKNFYD